MKLKYSEKQLKNIYGSLLTDPARGPVYGEIVATTEKQQQAAAEKLNKYGYIKTADYNDGQQYKLYYNGIAVIEIVICYWYL